MAQLDRTIAAGEAFGAQFRYVINNSAGTYAAVPDTATADDISYYGTAGDVNLPVEGTALTTCLSGALTPVEGGIQRTANAIPNVNPGQDGCVALGAMVKIATTATPADNLLISSCLIRTAPNSSTAQFPG